MTNSSPLLFSFENIHSQEIETYNTRLFKEEKDGHVTYILRLASVATTGEFKYTIPGRV